MSPKRNMRNTRPISIFLEWTYMVESRKTNESPIRNESDNDTSSRTTCMNVKSMLNDTKGIPIPKPATIGSIHNKK